MKQQQPVWSMGTRNPKTRHTNQLYLDEAPALRRALLSGPEPRAAYDAELAAVQIAEREQKLDELQRRVRLRAAKGGLMTADRTLLRDEAARIGLDGDVLDRLTRLIPTLTTTTGPADVEELDDDPPADVLDPSTRRQIRGALEHLGRRDLYDALGLFRDAPASIITARADEERQRWMRKAQVTAEKTAWLEIISHAQSHLTSPRARARYDRTLLLEAEESFDAVTVFALQGGLRRALASWSVSTPGRAQPLPQEPGHRGRLARDALAGLNRCPPDAPTGLEMQVLRDRVRLSWTPPPPDGLGPLTFAVMRKRGGLPQHPGDGTRIAEVSACEFEDRHLKPGETISYAVLAKRGEAESMTAVAVGPLVYLPDVQDVRVEPRAGEIELSWIPPHGVFEIRVVRKCGSPPAGPRDGERIAASLDQAVDSGLREDQVYHYAIYAIYRMADLRRYPSQGIVVAAFPRLPPPPMNAPRLMIMPSGHVRLDWTEPPRGSVRILRTTRPPPASPGAQLSVAAAEQFAGDWLALSGPDRAEDADPPATGFCYYTPLVMVGSMLTVGHPAALSRVADPSELRATRTGGPGEEASTASRILLRWRWAPEATATRLVARQGSPARGSSDPDAIVTRWLEPTTNGSAHGPSTFPAPHLLSQAIPSSNLPTYQRTVRSAFDRTTGMSVPSVLPRSTLPALFLRGWSRVPRPPCRARIHRLPYRIP